MLLTVLLAIGWWCVAPGAGDPQRELAPVVEAVNDLLQSPRPESCRVLTFWRNCTIQERSGRYRLIRDIFERYDPRILPVRETGQALRVKVGFSLGNIVKLDEKTQILAVAGWLTLQWRDEFIFWNPKEYDNVSYIIVPANKVFVPEVKLDNGAQTVHVDFHNFDVRISNDGEVFWEPGGTFTVSCKLDITHYPFDRQSCWFNFATWAYTADEIYLYNGTTTVNTDTLIADVLWQVESTTVDPGTFNLTYFPGKLWTYVIYRLHLRRKSLFYILNIIAPSCMLSVLILLMFYLPPGSGEKVTLGITVLLSLIVFMTKMSENIPETSECFPFLGRYLGAHILVAICAIMIEVGVLNLYYHDPYIPPAQWLLTCVRLRRRHPSGTTYRHSFSDSSQNFFSSELSDTDATALGPSQPNGDVQNVRPRQADEDGEFFELRQLMPKFSATIRDIERTLEKLDEGLQRRAKRKRPASSGARTAYHGEWHQIAKTFDQLFLVTFFLLELSINILLVVTLPIWAPLSIQ